MNPHAHSVSDSYHVRLCIAEEIKHKCFNMLSAILSYHNTAIHFNYLSTETCKVSEQYFHKFTPITQTPNTPTGINFSLHRQTYFYPFHLCKSVRFVNFTTNLNITTILELLKKIGLLTTEYPDNYLYSL